MVFLKYVWIMFAFRQGAGEKKIFQTPPGGCCSGSLKLGRFPGIRQQRGDCFQVVL